MNQTGEDEIPALGMNNLRREFRNFIEIEQANLHRAGAHRASLPRPPKSGR